MIKSPSKHISLKTLQQIKVDNYIGKHGDEYDKFEIDDLILQKISQKADEQVKKVIKDEVESASFNSSDAAAWSRVITSRQVMNELKEHIYFNQFYFIG
jgi:DNA-binding transcriptional regulator GbsR (MarR family)